MSQDNIRSLETLEKLSKSRWLLIHWVKKKIDGNKNPENLCLGSQLSDQGKPELAFMAKLVDRNPTYTGSLDTPKNKTLIALLINKIG